MKFSVNRELLLKPLQQVAGVVERRQTLPVLSNVLIQVVEDSVSLTGTDLEVELIGQVSTESAEAGEITVPARKLLDICKELPDKATVDFELVESRLLIRSGRFKSNLSTLPAADFPSVDKSAVEITTKIDSRAFKKLLDKTCFCDGPARCPLFSQWHVTRVGRWLYPKRSDRWPSTSFKQP